MSDLVHPFDRVHAVLQSALSAISRVPSELSGFTASAGSKDTTKAESKQRDQMQNESLLQVPQDPSHGDVATSVCLKLAKQYGLAPRALAEQLVAAIMQQPDYAQICERVEIAGPGFVNFFLKIDTYLPVLGSVLETQETFGTNATLNTKTVLIEHTSPNPNKEFHVGHLKNNVTGLAISYVLEASGATVIRDCVNNNRGIAIARLMWGYLEYARKDEASTPADIEYWYAHPDAWNTPKEAGMAPGKFIDALYVRAAQAAKEDPQVDQATRSMVIAWEAGDQKNRALWKQTQEWVWAGYRQALERVDGWKFDRIWNESEIYEAGKAHVERGVQEGIFRVLKDGAILTDLEAEFGLTDAIVQKNDGTALYITQDLELTRLKRETFHPDIMMWVIGPEQTLAMKQLFAVCDQLGFGSYKDFVHVPYGFILVKEDDGIPRKMSSRSGGALHVQDLIDRAQQDVLAYVTDDTLSEREAAQIAEAVAVGAIKYALLKVQRTQDQVFDYNSMIALEGDSGPYILYAYARAAAVVRRLQQDLQHHAQQDQPSSRVAQFLQNQRVADEEACVYDASFYETKEEQALLKLLSRYPESVAQAAAQYAPHLIATYAYQLATQFNRFYGACPILRAESDELRLCRIALTLAAKQVLGNALKLLGIQPIERM